MIYIYIIASLVLLILTTATIYKGMTEKYPNILYKVENRYISKTLMIIILIIMAGVIVSMVYRALSKNPVSYSDLYLSVALFLVVIHQLGRFQKQYLITSEGILIIGYFHNISRRIPWNEIQGGQMTSHKTTLHIVSKGIAYGISWKNDESHKAMNKYLDKKLKLSKSQ